MRAIAASFVIAALLAGGCQTIAPSMVADRMFFGRNIPAGGVVSESDWNDFLRSHVTRRFPKGLTVWQGSGQWLDPRGELVREPVFIVEVFHQPSDLTDQAIAAIAAEYKKRFGQDAVLRVITDSRIRFY